MQIKEDQASEFIMSLRADRETSIPLGIDPALLAAAKGGKGPLSANFLIACIATMMLPLRQCAVIAGNGAVMRVCLALTLTPIPQWICLTRARLPASLCDLWGCQGMRCAPVSKHLLACSAAAGMPLPGLSLHLSLDCAVWTTASWVPCRSPPRCGVEAWILICQLLEGQPVFRQICCQLKHPPDAVQAAKQAGVASIAVPPPLSARGTFPDADYAFDGFGPGGGITWRRVDALLTKQSA